MTADPSNAISEALRRQIAEGSQADEIFHLVVEAMPNAVVLASERGRILLMNAGSEKLFGHSRDELIGQPVEMLVPERYRAAHPHYRAAYAGRAEARPMGKGRDLFALRKDGSEVPVEIGLNPIQTREGPLILSVIVDITGRKRAEEKLRNSLSEISELKAALDEHAIVAITDPRGKITFVNDKFCAISKYSREELLGQDHRIINSGYHPKEFIRDLWTTIARGSVWHGEIKNRAKDGSFYWVDTTIMPFFNEQGKPRQYVAIRADIIERKAAEEAIQRLNADLEERVVERTVQLETANKELEAFSYSVSHDLRAPLRAIDGFSQALVEDFGPQLPEEGRRYLQTIREGAQRMGALIDDLLAFSRLSRQPVKKQSVVTANLVRAAVEELGNQRQGRQIEIRIGDLPPCEGDAVLLQQVWINLLSNALKYTRKREGAMIEAGSMRQNGGTVYFVRDNGTGFDMQYAGKLFGVFQRLHRMEDYEGTGVGLAIVQRIIHRHGGRGGGSWGDVLFQSGRRNQLMNETTAVELLLVEDNPQDLELAQRALKKANLTNRIQVARDGAEALEFIFCEGPHAGRNILASPKLIMLDLKLPKVDGLKVLRRLKEDPRTRTIPVVVLTSSKEQRDVVESYELGVNSYIVKPVDFERFATAVQELGFYWLLLNQPPKLNE